MKNVAPTGQIFMKFDVEVFLRNLSRKFKFDESLTGIMGTLCEDVCTFMIISH
jgi:hypothetical protein